MCGIQTKLNNSKFDVWWKIKDIVLGSIIDLFVYNIRFHDTCELVLDLHCDMSKLRTTLRIVAIIAINFGTSRKHIHGKNGFHEYYEWQRLRYF